MGGRARRCSHSPAAMYGSVSAHRTPRYASAAPIISRARHGAASEAKSTRAECGVMTRRRVKVKASSLTQILTWLSDDGTQDRASAEERLHCPARQKLAGAARDQMATLVKQAGSDGDAPNAELSHLLDTETARPSLRAEAPGRHRGHESSALVQGQARAFAPVEDDARPGAKVGLDALDGDRDRQTEIERVAGSGR